MSDHNPNDWPNDKRPIVAARLSSHPYGNQGIFLASDGFAFERFERNGDMVPLPFLRIVRVGASPFGLEAPLVNFDWVEFEELPL